MRTGQWCKPWIRLRAGMFPRVNGAILSSRPSIVTTECCATTLRKPALWYASHAPAEKPRSAGSGVAASRTSALPLAREEVLEAATPEPADRGFSAGAWLAYQSAGFLKVVAQHSVVTIEGRDDKIAPLTLGNIPARSRIHGLHHCPVLIEVRPRRLRARASDVGVALKARRHERHALSATAEGRDPKTHVLARVETQLRRHLEVATERKTDEGDVGLESHPGPNALFRKRVAIGGRDPK